MREAFLDGDLFLANDQHMIRGEILLCRETVVSPVELGFLIEILVGADGVVLGRSPEAALSDPVLFMGMNITATRSSCRKLSGLSCKRLIHLDS